MEEVRANRSIRGACVRMLNIVESRTSQISMYHCYVLVLSMFLFFICSQSNSIVFFTSLFIDLNVRTEPSAPAAATPAAAALSPHACCYRCGKYAGSWRKLQSRHKIKRYAGKSERKEDRNILNRFRLGIRICLIQQIGYAGI